MSSRVTEEVLLRVREIAAFVSGNHSPIYINCRQVISSPTFMAYFACFARAICEYNAIAPDVIAGGETAGIPFAAYLADALSLPMVYVRKAKKGHGLASFMEGQLPNESKVLLVEDLITDAGSKLHFIDAVRACSGIVKDVLVLFDRGQGGGSVLAKHGIRLHAITDMGTALTVAEESGLLSDTHLESVREYLGNMRAWHEKHGLPFKNVGQNRNG